MNKYERRWIKKQLTQILITDLAEGNDAQADHITEFLATLDNYIDNYNKYKTPWRIL